MLIQQIQPVNAGPQSRLCSTCWDAHFLKINAAWKIWTRKKKITPPFALCLTLLDLSWRTVSKPAMSIKSYGLSGFSHVSVKQWMLELWKSERNPKYRHKVLSISYLLNCPYLIGTVLFFYPRKSRKKERFYHSVPYLCKNLSVVLYRIFRNVPILKDFPPICPYFLGFRVGKYAILFLTDL